eukprot:15336189-Ditylum_brightwellii.AAC.1
MFWVGDGVLQKRVVSGSLLLWTQLVRAVHSWECVSVMLVRPQPPMEQCTMYAQIAVIVASLVRSALKMEQMQF